MLDFDASQTFSNYIIQFQILHYLYYLNKIQITFLLYLIYDRFQSLNLNRFWPEIRGIWWDDRVRTPLQKISTKCLNIKDPNAEMVEFVERKLIKNCRSYKKKRALHEVLIEKRFLSFFHVFQTSLLFLFNKNQLESHFLARSEDDKISIEISLAFYHYFWGEKLVISLAFYHHFGVQNSCFRSPFNLTISIRSLGSPGRR